MANFSRKWILTIHVPEALLLIPDLLVRIGESISHAAIQRPAGPKLTYLVGQLERAPTTLKLHVQAALSLSRSVRATAVKTLLTMASKTNLHDFDVSWLAGTHLEQAQDWAKVLSYCRKAETRVAGPWEYGADTGQGHRSDLESICQDLQSGASLQTIAMKQPATFIRNYKGLTVFSQLLLQPKRMESRKCALFWGKSGSGKTYSVFDVYPECYSVFDIKVPWFDGYTGQDCALFDECGLGMMNINYLKRLTDIYPMTVPVKGGCVSWNPRVVVLTSNTHFETWFHMASPEDQAALERRLRVFEFPREQPEAIEWLKSTIVVDEDIEENPSVQEN